MPAWNVFLILLWEMLGGTELDLTERKKGLSLLLIQTQKGKEIVENRRNVFGRCRFRKINSS